MKFTVTLIAAFIVCSLLFGYYSTELEKSEEVILSLQGHVEDLEDQLTVKQTVALKRKELNYAWPLHLDDYVEGELTSPFGKRDKNESGGSVDTIHLGLDMFGVSHVGTWHARIVAVADGVVEHHWLRHNLYGKHIIILHDDGNRSMYAHLSKSYIHEGDRVKRGDVIARQGSTGATKGEHLHFQLWIGDEIVNPLKWIEEPR